MFKVLFKQTQNKRCAPGFILLNLACLVSLLVHNFEHSLSNRSAAAIFSWADDCAAQTSSDHPNKQDSGLPRSSSPFPQDDCTTCRLMDYAAFTLSSLSACDLKSPMLCNLVQRPPLAPIHLTSQSSLLPFSARAPPFARQG